MVSQNRLNPGDFEPEGEHVNLPKGIFGLSGADISEEDVQKIKEEISKKTGIPVEQINCTEVNVAPGQSIQDALSDMRIKEDFKKALAMSGLPEDEIKEMAEMMEAVVADPETQKVKVHVKALRQVLDILVGDLIPSVRFCHFIQDHHDGYWLPEDADMERLKKYRDEYEKKISDSIFKYMEQYDLSASGAEYAFGAFTLDFSIHALEEGLAGLKDLRSKYKEKFGDKIVGKKKKPDPEN